MPDSDSAFDEKSRRKVIVAVSAVAFLVSFVYLLVEWFGQPGHRLESLFFLSIPPLSSCAFLAGLCVGFHTLSPWPRLTAVAAVMLPCMHLSLVVAVAHILTSRPNALTEPLPAQRTLLFWLEPGAYLGTAVAEVTVLLVAVGLMTVLKPRSPRGNPC